MSKQTIRSSKLKKKKKKIFIIKMSMFFLIIIGCVALLIYAFNTKYLEIQEVKVEGAQHVLNTQVQEYAENVLAGAYVGFIPKENILLYPKQEIEESIRSDFPRINDISLELDPFKERALYIALSERREVGVWCRRVGENNEDECYFIDNKGYVFAQAPVYSGGAVFVYRGGIQDEPLGNHFLDPESFTKLHAFIHAIQKSSKLSVLEPIELEQVTDNKYQIHLQSGAYIFINEQQELEQIYDTLVTVVDKEDIVISDIEYIDLRIEDKVFYKHKE